MITGEKIQELCDHSIVLNSDDNGAHPIVKAQLVNTDCEYTYFEANSPVSTLPSKITDASSIFVYPHILGFFFETIYPLLTKRFNLVTHNSDVGALPTYERYLNEDKIIKWYGSNIQFKHDKLVALPLGVANSQWTHGNLELIDKIRSEDNDKTQLVFKNFTINTNASQRGHINSATSDFAMEPVTTNEDYLRSISKSRFCICPPGNGTDCHRTWECLYLNCVPIVQRHVHNEAFEDAGIILVDRWEDITARFLEEQSIKVNRSYPGLDLEYWRNEIK
jgi:hypothetical protein